MIKRYLLFTTPMCPNCPSVKAFMNTLKVNGNEIDAASDEGLEIAQKYKINSVPSVVFFDDDDKVAGVAHTIDEIKRITGNILLTDLI